jgi:hypothetical protein
VIWAGATREELATLGSHRNDLLDAPNSLAIYQAGLVKSSDPGQQCCMGVAIKVQKFEAHSEPRFHYTNHCEHLYFLAVMSESSADSGTDLQRMTRADETSSSRKIGSHATHTSPGLELHCAKVLSASFRTQKRASQLTPRDGSRKLYFSPLATGPEMLRTICSATAFKAANTNDEGRCIRRLHAGHFRLMLERKSLSPIRTLRVLALEK